MSKKRILSIILACLAFFCMVPVKAQDAAFSQSEKGISLEEMTEKAEKGDTDVQYFLGTIYLSVVEEGKNQQKAVYWLQKAADQGHAHAQTQLGICYLDGIGIPEDPERAVELFEAASAVGEREATFQLGSCYRFGIGVDTDLEEAVRLARTHAVSGDIVTLSPACAAFDQFKNFMVRGETYKKLVMEL